MSSRDPYFLLFNRVTDAIRALEQDRGREDPAELEARCRYAALLLRRAQTEAEALYLDHEEPAEGQ